MKTRIIPPQPTTWASIMPALPPPLGASGRVSRARASAMVQAPTPVAAFSRRLAAARAGVPRVVYTAHGFSFHDRMGRLKRAAFISLEWLAGRVTDVLFTQAGEDAETARRLGLCRSGVIEAIGNGVDPGRFHPGSETRGDIRRALDTPGDAVVVMVVGRLVAEKGYPELLAAVRGLDVHLWVVGERLASDHARAIDAEIDAARGPRLPRPGARGAVPERAAAAELQTGNGRRPAGPAIRNPRVQGFWR